MPGAPRWPADLRAVPFRLGLRHTFRGVDAREGVLIQGPAGWGEFAPFADYSLDEDAYWLVAAVEAAVLPPPAPVRSSVAVNAILASGDAAVTGAAARHAVRELGCRTIKLKLAERPLIEDVARVAAVRTELDAALGRGVGRIRVDPNERWSLAQAVTGLTELVPFGLEYAEQPCGSWAELAELRRRVTDVPIAVDELVRRGRRFTGLAEVADVAVVKVSPLGGRRRTREVVAQVGLPVVVSGAMESSVGLGRDVRFVASLHEVTPDCGFGTGALLADDVCATSLVPTSGAIEVSAVHAPDDDAVAAAAERLSRQDPTAPSAWLARMTAAWEQALESGLVPADELAVLA